MVKSLKVVHFNLSNNKVFYTYSNTEYDRLPIDSILLKKFTNEISEIDWVKNKNELLRYIHYEMIVHKDSL